MYDNDEIVTKKFQKACFILTILTGVILLLLNFTLFTFRHYSHNQLREFDVEYIETTENSIILTVDNQQLNISKEKLEDNLIIDIRDIVDWNTDGTEIALSLANGNELYATQTQNIYAPKFKNYVGFNEIQSVEETETEIHITTKDGNIYTIKK